ncbi:MAG TPA: tagaturonate epimerase family protein [Pirellulales bacterium]|nr:tagaturonate epimerase family protein [Pirellulales bacterium]
MNVKPSILGLQPTFGFGDRLGVATPGHVKALCRTGGPIRGIFAQQSIREMSRTGRTAQQVMQAATEALSQVNYVDAWGADADHLKTSEDVHHTAQAGFTFFTIDPSDYVDRKADDYGHSDLEEKYFALGEHVNWVDLYLGKVVRVPHGPEILFDRPTVLRTAVKYGNAISHALQMGECIQKAVSQRGGSCELELSVDETDQPTSAAEHYIFADQLRRHGLPLVSLAPRFIGNFEKGVDYKGDLQALTTAMSEHAAIAQYLGPYKLSLHSGSDKLSMYGCLARSTGGLFHVKTAGTSYMEALRVVALRAPAEFREIVSFARERYNADKATYHVSATIESVPGPAHIADDIELQKIYLERWIDVPTGRGFTSLGRQILHCTFGSILTDPRFGPLVMQVVRENQALYNEVLIAHFQRHLNALNAG